jgi:hypothetical protein
MQEIENHSFFSRVKGKAIKACSRHGDLGLFLHVSPARDGSAFLEVASYALSFSGVTKIPGNNLN